MEYKRIYTPHTHPVIAIDLDNTIWTENYPDVGDPFPNAIETINDLISEGYEVIIWTARSWDNLRTCKLQLIDKYQLNPNVKFNAHSNYFTSLYEVSSPKVNASVYLDDRAIFAPDYKTEWSNIRKLFLDD